RRLRRYPRRCRARAAESHPDQFQCRGRRHECRRHRAAADRLDSPREREGAMTPPLKPLHSDEAILPLKLAEYGQRTTDELIDSVRPGKRHSLKTHPDGTILDGHHRVRILRNRGVDVDALPREIVEKEG